MHIDIKCRLSTSAHYLRHFILGGYVAFLLQVPKVMKSDITLDDLSWLGICLTILCVVMDMGNYFKYRSLIGEWENDIFKIPLTTVFVQAFYLGCFFLFVSLPSQYGG